MKKYLKLIMVFMLFGTLGFLGYQISKKVQYKKEVSERIQTIPSFSFFNLEKEVFQNKDLKENTYKLFVYYNSECEYCQSEATQISKNLENFKNTQLVFVSFEPMEGIKQFAIDYHLNGKENVLFLQDKKLEFAEIFDAKSIPFMLLYAKDNQLIQLFKGATKIDNILKHIN